MRFLADMGVSLTTVEAWRAAKHDAVHLRDEGLIRLPDPGYRGESGRWPALAKVMNLPQSIA